LFADSAEEHPELVGEDLDLPDEVYGFGSWLLWVLATRATAVVDRTYAAGPARPSRHYGTVDGHPVPTPSLVAWLLTAAEARIQPDRLTERNAQLDERQKVLRTIVSRAVGGEPRLFKDAWLRQLAAMCGLGEPELDLLARCRDEEGYPVDPQALRTAIARTFRAHRAGAGGRPVTSGETATRSLPRDIARFADPVRGELPRVWNVSLRNPNFTGRGQELAELAAGLAAGTTVTVQSVRGMGGVGKTQLATEFAYLHAGDYDVVWQITAENPALIPGQFADLAARLGLEPARNLEMLKARVHRHLCSTSGWLMIFDNADAVQEIMPWLPGGLLPAEVRGHVIVTTRRSGFSTLGQVMNLDVIDLLDAVHLLRSRVPGLDKEFGVQIAEELGRLPLALDQAAAYLDQSQLPGEEYLELLRSNATGLYHRGTLHSHATTIATLWRVSLDRIAQESPAARQLLEICAYLAPEPIPLDLFTSHCTLLPEPLSSIAADRLAFTDLVAIVADYSVARRSAAGLQLHRLVQGVIRADSASYPLKEALALLRADAPEMIMGNPEAWPKWAVLLPHVLAAVAHLDQVAGQPDSAMMMDASFLLDRAGTYLQVHDARLTDARPLLERSLALAETAYGPGHTEVAERLNNLAIILRNLGQPEAARPLLEKAMEIGHPDPTAIAARMTNLALVLRDLKQPDEALPLVERALAIDEATYGHDHPDIAIDLNNLALILRASGRPQDARPRQERALAIIETAYGPDHPSVATALNNLALILHALELPQDARLGQERALAIDEGAYGPSHPAVARDLTTLARIFTALNQPHKARPLQERALAINEATHGPHHPDVAASLDGLAEILHALNEPEAALELQKRAQAITRTSDSAKSQDGK
jgi:tetratricopeptide (TPR) repeat protein